jgi:hypothetical protein
MFDFIHLCKMTLNTGAWECIFNKTIEIAALFTGLGPVAVSALNKTPNQQIWYILKALSICRLPAKISCG